MKQLNTTILITHPSLKKVLTIQEIFPVINTGPLQDEMVGTLQKAFQEIFGLRVAIGRQLYKGTTDKHSDYIYDAQLLEPITEDFKFNWVSLDDIQNGDHTKDEFKPILDKLLTEQEIPASRAPWFLVNYYHEVEKWIESEVEKAGLGLIDDINQVKASDFSLILEVPTDQDVLYFKATGVAGKHEAALSKHLAERHYGKSVEVVAVDESKGWLLLKDIGGEALRNIKDNEIWKRALSAYAAIQVAELESVDKLRSLGVPDRSMSILKEEIQQHLAPMCATGLSEEETEKIMSLLPELLEMCDRLDALLPASIEHGDLHSNNIGLIDDSYVFFDWGDASISHPFFSTRVFWNSLDVEDSKWIALIEEFRPYYLEQWEKFAPMEKLVEAHRISDELGCVQRALSWHLYLTPSREDKADSYQKPSQWLQLLLEHRELVGKL